MNNIRNIGKMTLAAVVGSLLWAGCATSPVEPAEGSNLETTVDLTRSGPDTMPEFNNDLYSPYQSGWTIKNIE